MKEKQDHKNIIKMKRIYYILISVAAIAVIGVSLQFCKIGRASCRERV